MSKYVIITPVRDEQDYIRFTLDSVIGQTLPPIQWIIVDDGSTDDTPQIVDEISRQYSWIQVVHRPNRGFRKNGGGVIDAFYDGYAKIASADWDYLVKLDGDLSFEPEYFEKCFSHFTGDHSLGLGGGMVCQVENGKPREDSRGDPPFHVRGATKIYRRECWEKIEPLVRAPGWDTIDEVKANMYGWHSRTFRDVCLVQHKLTGSADGSWNNWFKNGLANYVTGYHPVFMMAKCLKRAFQSPLSIHWIALWVGFCSGYVRTAPQVGDASVIQYLRKHQIRRLSGRSGIYG